MFFQWGIIFLMLGAVCLVVFSLSEYKRRDRVAMYVQLAPLAHWFLAEKRFGDPLRLSHGLQSMFSRREQGAVYATVRLQLTVLLRQWTDRDITCVAKHVSGLWLRNPSCADDVAEFFREERKRVRENPSSIDLHLVRFAERFADARRKDDD